MADYKLSTGNAPSLPLLPGDKIEISQLRSGVWSTAVITLEQLLTYVAGAIELDAAKITSGALPIARGGTNATTKEDARASLEVADLTGNNFVGNQSVTGTVTATAGFDIP